MKFKREFLQDLAYGDHDSDVEIIENKLVGSGRWTLRYELVFKYQEKYWSVGYNIGATELQDKEPFEYEDDEIEVDEVFPVEKTIVVYE